MLMDVETSRLIIEDHGVQLRAIKLHQVGSSWSCDPPPNPVTDVDFLMLVPDRSDVTGTKLHDLGYVLDDGNVHYDPSEGEFNSWRRGKLNLILTDCEEFYESFMLASRVAKKLNLLNKKDRIDLFQAILYGNS